MLKKEKITILCSVALGLLIFTTIVYNGVFKRNVPQENTNELKSGSSISLMLETTVNSGEYKLSESSKWPSSGYIYNAELSYCENGSTLSWNEETNSVRFKTRLTDKCYVYFDKIQKAVIDSVSTSDITTTSLTLTINATKGTFDISNYYYSIDNGSTWNESASNVISISGLTKGTTYTIITYAQDSTGINSENKSISVLIPSISFTWCDETYYAEDNMTWSQFINSTYNTGSFGGGSSMIMGDCWYGGLCEVLNGYSTYVSAADKIIDGKAYRTGVCVG